MYEGPRSNGPTFYCVHNSKASTVEVEHLYMVIGDFRTLYNHVILDHRQCPLFIFPNDHNGRLIFNIAEIFTCGLWINEILDFSFSSIETHELPGSIEDPSIDA